MRICAFSRPVAARKRSVWTSVMALGAVGCFTTPAFASQQLNVQMTFQSGASFSGIVTFTDDYSSVLDVDGTLTGYQYSTNGYLGSGTDAINWVWNNGSNAATGAGNYSTFLMDGAGSGYTPTGSGGIYGNYSNWIQLSYNYSAAPVLLFTSGVGGSGPNAVDYVDPMVAGFFSAVSGVPEPATWAMMLLGFGGIGFAVRRKRPALLQQTA